MELLVVRHAIAFERDAQRWPDDGERPLSPKGIARARKAAAGLKRITEPPTRVLTSPLVRTRQTAEILSRFAGWPKAAPCVQLRPGTAPERLFAFLAGAEEPRIGIVGHQPDLSRLVAACLPGGAGSTAVEFRKMSVALLAFPGAACAAQGELLWLLPPRILRATR